MSLRAELLRFFVRTFLKSRREAFDIDAWRRSMRVAERLVPAPPARSEYAEVEARGLNFHRVVMPTSRPRRNVLYLLRWETQCASAMLYRIGHSGACPDPCGLKPTV